MSGTTDGFLGMELYAGDSDLDLPYISLPGPPGTSLHPNALQNESPEQEQDLYKGSNNLESQGLPGWGISQVPVHLPTSLIEHWFRYVCPGWSTFDSEINYNRQLAWQTWTTSEPVYYTLQAMSAACFVDSSPQLRNILMVLRTQATTVIDQSMLQLRTAEAPPVTTDLVFAVFALGTSLHWNAPAFSNNQWQATARELLTMWKAHQLSALDTLLHAYFCQALTYWELLLTAAGSSSLPSQLDSRRQKYKDRLCQAMHVPQTGIITCDEPIPRSLGQSQFGTRPNSWCGVSNEVIDMFQQVLALCRGAWERNQNAGAALTMDVTSSALCDIFLAQELQQELLDMNFGSIISIEEEQGFSVETQDENTPITHLLQTAEAYRHAAVLQLCLSFTDLPMTTTEKNHIGSHSMRSDNLDSPINNLETRPENLLALALRVVHTLEQIPAQSGSRSIHSILYLSAATGLRFPPCPILGDRPQNATLDPFAPCVEQPPCNIAQQVGADKCVSQHTSNFAQFNNGFMPRSTLDVCQARQLVLTRLSKLQETPLHKMGCGILGLVKAIWQKYDSAEPGGSSTHWFDVMAEAGSGQQLW